MINKKIIYVQPHKLTEPQFRPIIDRYPQFSWDNFSMYNTRYNTGMDSFYSRSGLNNLPLKTDILNYEDFAMPKYNPEFRDTFETVTDRRYFELVNNYSDRPWLLLWSGGIDSTIALVSILKNAQAGDLDRIVIGCNRVSVYEYPDFFYKFIQPNFQILDTTKIDYTLDFLKKYYIIDGEPADQLVAGGSSLRMSVTDHASLSRNCFTDKDPLINYIANNTTLNFARWFYDSVIQNIKSVDVPIENYHDFFWWVFFNYTWIPAQMRNLKAISNNIDNGPQMVKQYLKSFVPWFKSEDYQQWSMNNNQKGIKYGQDVSEYKLEYKKYIHKFYHDDYYYRFKLKGESLSRRPAMEYDYFCMLDDYTRLTVDRDLDLILQLLPEHINA